MAMVFFFCLKKFMSNSKVTESRNYTLNQLFYRFCKEEGFYDKVKKYIIDKNKPFLALWSLSLKGCKDKWYEFLENYSIQGIHEGDEIEVNYLIGKYKIQKITYPSCLVVANNDKHSVIRTHICGIKKVNGQNFKPILVKLNNC